MALKPQGMVMKIIRKFSAPMRDTNQCFIAKEKTTYKQTSVLFVVLEHFSLMSFTCAVDCLVTSNLVEGSTRFTFATVGLGNGEVLSDLGIGLTPDHSLDEVKALQDIDAVIVCGGYRTCLNEHPQLSKLIALSSKCNTILGGFGMGLFFLPMQGFLMETNMPFIQTIMLMQKKGFPVAFYPQAPMWDTKTSSLLLEQVALSI